MVLYKMMKLCREYIYLISIILLATSIDTKNTKICRNNLIASSFLIFFGCSLIIIPQFIGIDYGLDMLFIAGAMGLDCIILIINIIIDAKKIKQEEMKNESNIFIRSYLVIVIIIPIALIAVPFFNEISILNDCDVVVTYNYQIGIIASEDTKYAIGKDYCKEVCISERFIKKNVKNTEHYDYYIEYSDVGNGYVVTSYDDPELNEIDNAIVEKLYKDVKIKDNEQKGHEAYLRKIKGTNYYIISHLGIGAYVYNGTTRIGEIVEHGGIEAANIYL